MTTEYFPPQEEPIPSNDVAKVTAYHEAIEASLQRQISTMQFRLDALLAENEVLNQENAHLRAMTGDYSPTAGD